MVEPVHVPCFKGGGTLDKKVNKYSFARRPSVENLACGQRDTNTERSDDMGRKRKRPSQRGVTSAKELSTGQRHMYM